MFPFKRQTFPASLAKIGLTLFAIATAFTLVPDTSAAPGDLYATDLLSNSIVAYKPDGTFSTFGSGFTLNSPQGLAFSYDPQTHEAVNLYVADGGSGNVYMYTPDGLSRTMVASGGFSLPVGVALNGMDLLVSENTADKVTAVSPSGGESVFPLTVTAPLGITQASINQIDTIYVAASNGTFSVAGGTVTTIYSGADGRNAAVDASGNVFLSTGSGEVKKFPAGGGLGTTFASGLGDPHGMAFRPPNAGGVQGVGDLFVADQESGTIFMITPQGAKSNFVVNGKPNYLAFEDGPLIPVIDSELSASGTIGQAFSYQITATNSPMTFDATGLPAGLTVDTGTGLISGTPSAMGTFLVNLSATNSAGTGTAVLTLDVSPAGAPVITSATSGTTMEGQPYSYQIVATNSPTSYDATSLPAGLTVDTGTGLISGTPSVSGVFPINLSATNSLGTGNAVLTLTVTAIVTPPPSPTPGLLQNISTRDDVLTGDDVLIGGFIVNGSPTAKNVLIRAIGPSLSDLTPPVAGALADPVLELHTTVNGVDTIVASDDNWQDDPAQAALIMATGLPPSNPLESALVETLAPVDPNVAGSGQYTAIVSGKNGGTGVALMEVYDLDDPLTATSQLANISTRGFVGAGDNVLIGGYISGPGTDDGQVLLRAIGPSLSASGVPGPLQDPTLELFDANGSSIAFNDNWQDTQGDEILATGLAPTNPSESAILEVQEAGSFTAIVRGVNNTTGIALVEAYHLPNATPTPSAAPGRSSR